MNENHAVFIGYGESEDPLPELPQLTRYRIFAGPCKECGCAGRKIMPDTESLKLVCDKCQGELQTTIPNADYPEVTYIYWCNSSSFATDKVELSAADRQIIAELEGLLLHEYEVPHWAVPIIGGRCNSSDQCINWSCPYLIKSQ